MKDLVEYIAKSLVTKPEDVEVIENQQEGAIELSLKVNPEDMGLIIGKGGQMIKSIRKLLTVRAIAENVRVSLYLVEVPQAEAPKESDQNPQPPTE